MAPTLCGMKSIAVKTLPQCMAGRFHQMKTAMDRPISMTTANPLAPSDYKSYAKDAVIRLQ
eukprot:6271691-Karenia_brevis.AAC.1